MANSRPQDEVQHWRRVRKAMASLLGDASRGQLTWSDAKQVLEQMHDLAQEREKAWIQQIIDKEK